MVIPTNENTVIGTRSNDEFFIGQSVYQIISAAVKIVHDFSKYVRWNLKFTGGFIEFGT